MTISVRIMNSLTDVIVLYKKMFFTLLFNLLLFYKYNIISYSLLFLGHFFFLAISHIRQIIATHIIINIAEKEL
jgi:hypothetical protein